MIQTFKQVVQYGTLQIEVEFAVSEQALMRLAGRACNNKSRKAVAGPVTARVVRYIKPEVAG